jgi:hypothetical protein
MLYFFHGENSKEGRAKAGEMMNGLLKKKPDASVFRLTVENWNPASFEEYLGGQGLFNNKFIVFLDNLLEDAVIKETVLENLVKIKQSQNIFVWLERKIGKPVADKIKKFAEKTSEFAEKKEDSREFSLEDGRGFSLGEFNIFSLTDAFGRRDRKNLWVLYQKAVLREIPAEEISGVLFWQLKSMFLASVSKTASEAGMKPFVFSKAKSFARNYKEEELKKISSELVSIYHDSHRGLCDFDIALERFILKI